MTIEQTLQEAGFTESFIRHLTPEIQGKSISMHTAIADLSEPFIRLRSFPLRGGVGATASTQPKDVRSWQMEFFRMIRGPNGRHNPTPQLDGINSSFQTIIRFLLGDKD